MNEADITAEELLADGAQQILSFGPALIEDGSVVVSEDDEVEKAKTSNPQTAIDIMDDLHYVFVVSDGRTDESAGLFLSQLAEFMKEFGIVTAYNLDGGGSSTMYFNGEVINNPTTSGRSIKERSVSDIVYEYFSHEVYSYYSSMPLFSLWWAALFLSSGWLFITNVCLEKFHAVCTIPV